MSETMLVTGGAGFIGSHLVERLHALGHNVRVLDNLSQGRIEWVHPSSEFIEGDIVDAALCKQPCAGVTGVFHLAAMSKVAPSIDKIEYCTEQNVIGNGSFFSTKGKILTPIGTICFTIDAIPAPPQSHSTVFRRRKPSENKPFNPVFGSKCPEFAWSAPAAPKAES